MLMDIEPFSLVDYPGHIVATVFFGGCNFQCGYCHNPALVNKKEKSRTSPSAVIEFMKTRKGLLDGVCLTGGEPLLSPDLNPFVREVKALGFKVKLDTNGSSPEKLRELALFLDYIAMDIKCTPDKYEKLTACKNSGEAAFETIQWIRASTIAYEFRTTVLPVWHTFEDLKLIREFLGNETPWVLQQFRQSPQGVLDGKTYDAYPDSWLKEMGEKLNCPVRGLK
ncbi:MULTISPECIES: anaerobic ribonucleoside-triphosphate reductase activating protein [unclassified Dehalobacter]|uniref:anaerobic ribonucleoside-triphosphate reductase activating protein n=1 Tax=unclassified Dehalobacter TaxID=2635733 RepID=UPI000E6C9F16|nr:MULTISPECIES: anaerobic ribonucleoside-triphosphate reductase activating protein [unclassified Dehalobacter]RJE48241.1 anaerobic ribonucleoside-triphosphate reductase activating protein [Dehalobacter sp. MCB1]TCX49722.1 anaerobic ribonucleoside-triphosphate reductase activating protein [Dehalobacter sp. 14DCB1]TCX50155.1 anaerobic ribonucleoside-triphosphate reductase activating protein [Dehalobacter sp. 12DCB1]